MNETMKVVMLAPVSLIHAQRRVEVKCAFY